MTPLRAATLESVEKFQSRVVPGKSHAHLDEVGGVLSRWEEPVCVRGRNHDPTITLGHEFVKRLFVRREATESSGAWDQRQTALHLGGFGMRATTNSRSSALATRARTLTSPHSPFSSPAMSDAGAPTRRARAARLSPQSRRAARTTRATDALPASPVPDRARRQAWNSSHRSVPLASPALANSATSSARCASACSRSPRNVKDRWTVGPLDTTTRISQ